VAIHDVALRFFREQLTGSWVPGYLTERGFDGDVQQRWQAGYAPAGWDTLTRHLRAAHYPDSLIEAAGLARRSRHGLIDLFRDRAVLPIRAGHGAVVAFIGRAAPHAGPDVPKYLNSPTTPLYGKRAVLFGLGEARAALASGATPVIAEGPLDVIAIALAGHGRYAPVAPCGAALTAQQAAALGRACDLSAREVLVAFDADRAGRRAAIGTYQRLNQFGAITTAVTLPAGRDPAQILRDHGPSILAAALAQRRQPLADLVVDAEADNWCRWLSYAEGQIGALRATARVVAAMSPSDVGRQVGRLADWLGLDHATVTAAVTDALTDLHTEQDKRHSYKKRIAKA
jgi:DNA primase catalytic core